MEYVESKSGLNISRMALGCMNLPVEDEIAAEEIIEYALSQHINFFDTADLYQFGGNEETVGKILKRYQSRYNFYIGTKVGNEFDRSLQLKTGWNPGRKYIKAEIKASLRRLGMDHIDLYQLHGGTIEDDMEDTILAFEELKSEGLIRSYGISSIRPNVIDSYYRKSNMDTLMLQLNPLDNRPEEFLEALEGITILARGPLMQGLFTDRHEYHLKEKFPDGIFNYSQEELSRIFTSLDSHHDDLTAISFKYLIDKGAVIVNGVSSLEQLEKNMESLKNAAAIDEDELKAAEQLFKKERYEVHRL